MATALEPVATANQPATAEILLHQANGSAHLASFSDCLLDVLVQQRAAKDPPVNLAVRLHSKPIIDKNGQPRLHVCLSPANVHNQCGFQAGSERFALMPLGHARDCPILRNKQLPEAKPEQKTVASGTHTIPVAPSLKVGVCVLIQDHVDRVLFTRRSARLRSFPSAW